MNKFTPFKDDDSALVFTDNKGNEFNVENGVDAIKVFGKLEGDIKSDNFLNVVGLFNNILKSMEKISSVTGAVSNFKATLKDDKFKLDMDIEIEKNAAGHALTQKIVEKLKNK